MGMLFVGLRELGLIQAFEGNNTFIDDLFDSHPI